MSLKIEVIKRAAYQGVVALDAMDEDMKDLVKRAEQLKDDDVMLVQLPKHYGKAGSFRDRVSRAFRRHGKFSVNLRTNAKHNHLAIWRPKAKAQEAK